VIAVAILVAALPGTRFRPVVRDGFSSFVGADGQPFWSFGVCVVDRGSPYDAKNPGYDATRHYVSNQDWATDVTHRLSDWGFNTVGAWSDAKSLTSVQSGLRFMPVLHMGSTAGAPWRDIWDPKVVGEMAKLSHQGIAPLAKESRVVGYFSDNEMGWWLGALWDWAWKAGPASRARLIALLRQRYRGSWAALTKDFVPVKARDFESLAKAGRLYLRPASDGMETLQAWQGVVADRYYSLCRKFIKTEDPGALYLGDRYISNFYPIVAKASAKYVDVCSTNFNPDWSDGTYSPFFLPALYRAVRKPILISEYYMCATENRSGNKNDSSGFPVVKTQAERAARFVDVTSALRSTPYLIGAHWFQYYDEPRNGRPDGENYNMGLVDIDNSPYLELVRSARKLRDSKRRYVASGNLRRIPEVSPDVAKDFVRWPHLQTVVPSSGQNDRGDLFLAQSNGHLFIAAYWNEDRFSEALYRDGKIPLEDEPSFTVSLNENEFKLRLTEHPKSQNLALRQSSSGVRNLRLFETKMTFQPGEKLRFSARLDTRARAFRMSWRGNFTLE
jgi:hypothetical protein